MSDEIYRSCAAILLLRPSNVCSPDGSACTPSGSSADRCDTLYEVLLVHKPRKNDAWQLPQGGVEEGESIQQAALRELKEEAGVSAEVIGMSEKTYQYDFPDHYRRFRPDNVCGQKVHFVFAQSDGSTVSVDGEEIDQHLWVLPEQVAQHLERKEYLSLVLELYDEAVANLKS